MLLKLTLSPRAFSKLFRVQRFLLADDKSIRFLWDDFVCADARWESVSLLPYFCVFFFFGNFFSPRKFISRMKRSFKTNIKNHFYNIIIFRVSCTAARAGEENVIWRLFNSLFFSLSFDIGTSCGGSLLIGFGINWVMTRRGKFPHTMRDFELPTIMNFPLNPSLRCSKKGIKTFLSVARRQPVCAYQT